MADTGLARALLSSRRPVAWITGASTGLGRATALGLARAGYELVLAGRSLQRHEDVLYACDWLGAPVRFVELDLADLGSVARAATTARNEGGAIEALVLNAGVAGARGRTIDGFELAFGVNHLGHLMLATMLMPLLRASRAARIVTVASRAHLEHAHIDWGAVRRPTRTRTGWHEYGVSKLANVVTSRALATELTGTSVTTYALHPDVSSSEPPPAARQRHKHTRGWKKLAAQAAESAARTTLRCVIDPQLARETGLYYERGGRAEPSRVVEDEALQRELLARSRSWIAPFVGLPAPKELACHHRARDLTAHRTLQLAR